MILTCSQCQTRYAVNPASIGKAGRIVRCVKCQYSWFQAPPEPSLDSAAPPEETPRATAGASLPAVKPEEPKPAGRAAWPAHLAAALVLLALLSAGIAWRDQVMTRAPKTQPIYALLGLYSTDGVTLTNLSLTPLLGGPSDTFVLRGAFVNQALAARHIPVLRVAVTDAEGKVLQREDFSDAHTLKAGETKPFDDITLKIRFRASSHVVVDIGNPLELALRS